MERYSSKSVRINPFYIADQTNKDLFAWSGIFLLTQKKNQINSSKSFMRRPPTNNKVVLIASLRQNNKNINIPKSRHIMTNQVIHLSKVIGRHAPKVALNAELSYFFGKYSSMHRLCSQMYKSNIKYLGDLVQLDDARILKFSAADEKKLGIIKERIGDFNLTLEMKIFGWDRPDETLSHLRIK